MDEGPTRGRWGRTLGRALGFGLALGGARLAGSLVANLALGLEPLARALATAAVAGLFAGIAASLVDARAARRPPPSPASLAASASHRAVLRAAVRAALLALVVLVYYVPALVDDLSRSFVVVPPRYGVYVFAAGPALVLGATAFLLALVEHRAAGSSSPRRERLAAAVATALVPPLAHGGVAYSAYAIAAFETRSLERGIATGGDFLFKTIDARFVVDACAPLAVPFVLVLLLRLRGATVVRATLLATLAAAVATPALNALANGVFGVPGAANFDITAIAASIGAANVACFLPLCARAADAVVGPGAVAEA